MGGLEVTRRMIQRNAAIKVIVVSRHLEEPYPSRMLAAGAAGYISKDSAAEEVVAAIRRVHGGGHYVAADVAGNLAASLVKGPNGASPFDQLSQRETQVRSEEHTSELQSLMRISYAVFCLKKKKKQTHRRH